MKISVDDGCASDLMVADLADKYKVETIFYWPVDWNSLMYSMGYKPLRYWDACTLAKNFEIGSHTITHRHLTKIDIGDAFEEIISSKDILEQMFNVDITKFCPPRGYTNTELTKITLDHYESQRLTRGANLVHVHPNSGANGNKHWLEAVKGKDTNRLELWMHSWELDKYDLWKELEEYLGSLN